MAHVQHSLRLNTLNFADYPRRSDSPNDDSPTTSRACTRLRERGGNLEAQPPTTDNDDKKESNVGAFQNDTSWFSRLRQSYVYGESRHPLLQSTVDDLAREENDSTNGPLTPDSTTTTESPSPIESHATSRAQAIPKRITPPKAFSSQCDSVSSSFSNSLFSKMTDSPRTRTVRRSRGSSLRAGSASLNSPNSAASAFLSQFNRPEVESAPIEPDDAGQLIGENGEYVIGARIGYGGFGVVKEVVTIEKDRKILRAVKIVRKQIKDRSSSENDRLQLDFEREIAIWRTLKHPYILPLIGVYENTFATFCITRLNTGGTLFDLVRSMRRSASSAAFSTASSTTSLNGLAFRQNNANSESTCPSIPQKNQGLPFARVKRYTHQLASALRYLHQDARVVHRDIKLENCLLDTTRGRDGTILLCDFGMADFIRPNHRGYTYNLNSISIPAPHHNIGPSPMSTSINGSLQYASPELITAPEPVFSPAVDVWAFGVLVFALLAGELPFSHPLLPKLQALILEGEWDLERFRRGLGEREEWEDVLDAGFVESELDAAVELVTGCLDMDAGRRWDVERVLGCEFLKDCRELE